MTALAHTKDFWVAFALIMFALVVVSGYTSINAVCKSRAFSRRRAGFGRWFSLRHRRFTFRRHAEYIALSFKDHHHR